MKTRILIVEDNPINQIVAKKFVTRAGYEADIANDGAEGVEAVLAVDYAVVLMDLQMPVMDGFAATRAIRNHPSLQDRQPHIIAMTAFAMPDDRHQCLAAGMDGYISKPVDSKKLLATLNVQVPIERGCPQSGKAERAPR